MKKILTRTFQQLMEGLKSLNKGDYFPPSVMGFVNNCRESLSEDLITQEQFIMLMNQERVKMFMSPEKEESIDYERGRLSAFKQIREKMNLFD